MKNIFRSKLFLFLLVLPIFNACIVPSSNPYFTKDMQIKFPQTIQGEWTLKDSPRPWVINPHKIITYDDKNIKSTLEVRFFNVNGDLYCDSTPGKPENLRFNGYWAFHLQPVHLLSRVKYTKNSLVFSPMNPRKLNDLIKRHKLILTSSQPGENSEKNVYFAKSSEWVKFLKKYGATPGLFAGSTKVVLKR